MMRARKLTVKIKLSSHLNLMINNNSKEQQMTMMILTGI